MPPASTRAIEPPPAPLEAMSRLLSAMRWPGTRAGAIHDQGLLARDDQADVGAGAAHVERDQIRLAREPRRVDAAGDPAGRPRQHAAGCEPSPLAGPRDPAIGRI